MSNPSWDSPDQQEPTDLQGGGGDQESTEQSEGRSKTRSRRTSRRGGSFTPAQARKAVQAVARMHAADEQILAVAATLAGTPTGDPEELAIAVLTGKVRSSQAIKDVTEIAAADEVEAAVLAGILPKARLRGAWDLVRSTGAGLPAELPDADVKAAIALSKAIHGRTDEQVAVLQRAAELLAD